MLPEPAPVKASAVTLRPEPVSLYSSLVMHRRLFPVAYRFTYRVFNLLIDVDRLAEADKASWLFSVNRFNLFSFYARHHLPEGETDLRLWAEKALKQFNVQQTPAHIQILCFPSILGHVFNPLSIWYCTDEKHQPIAVICEVRNTFGEKHCYLLHDDHARMPWPVRQRHAKDFHVSPLISMQADYEFRLAEPGAMTSVGIREYQDNRLMLVATLKGRQQVFNSLNLIKQFIRVPMQTLKVLAAIHWRALKIWVAGAPFYTKPPAPHKEIS